VTHNRNFKGSVRARMAATGENYTTALRAIQAERGAGQQLPELQHVDPPTTTPAEAADIEAWRAVHWQAPTNGGDQ
jgi:hypothetical protein